MSHESPNRIAGKEHVMEQSTWTRLRWNVTPLETKNKSSRKKQNKKNKTQKKKIRFIVEFNNSNWKHSFESLINTTEENHQVTTFFRRPPNFAINPQLCFYLILVIIISPRWQLDLCFFLSKFWLNFPLSENKTNIDDDVFIKIALFPVHWCHSVISERSFIATHTNGCLSALIFIIFRFCCCWNFSHVRWMMTATATRQWKPVQVTPLPRKNLEQTRPAADTRRFTINRGPPTVYNISSLGT